MRFTALRYEMSAAVYNRRNCWAIGVFAAASVVCVISRAPVCSQQPLLVINVSRKLLRRQFDVRQTLNVYS